MTIEVRQLVIKSTVVKEETPAKSSDGSSSEGLEQLKAEILLECKQLVRDAIRDARER